MSADGRQVPDSTALESALRRRLDCEIGFDPGHRALYATDGSIYREVPTGVVVPRTVEDLVTAVAVCHEQGAPMFARGGGTSLAGQCCNEALAIDCSKYLRRIVELNAEQRYAIVEPGCVLDELRDAAEKHHLTFGPDPSTHAHNTLGGMIGNNSCGVHSVMAGRTADNVIALEILTYDGLRMWVGETSDAELESHIAGGGRKGEIYAGLKAIRERYAAQIRARYPKIPRRVSGYNLDNLLAENGCNVARALVGSEGTCITILHAKLRLVDSPPARSLLVLGYPSVFEAGDHVVEIRKTGAIGIEGLDDVLIGFMKKKNMHPQDRELLPPGGGWLLVEFGGENKEESDAKAQQLMNTLKRAPAAPSMKLFDDPHEEKMLWKVRESGLGATARVPGEPAGHPGWEDAAVPPAQVGPYLRDFRALLDRYGYQCALYGHFGDGCIHCRISFDFSRPDTVVQWRNFMNDASDLVLSYGGSNSGEHGDGQVRASLLPKMFGAELMTAFREFKSLWDPQWRMNPGKVVDPRPMDADFRVGPEHRHEKIVTWFAYPADDNSFAKATQRCVGVGNCRNLEGGVMCPSYRATLDEQHSTRGRARLLFEMLEGAPIAKRWQSTAVREALDLCLACKGCKHDCPVNVDMANYKAEFMARHYHGRLRPRAAYSMGLIFWWCRVASVAPRLVNALLRVPPFAALARALGGLAKQRALPRFAAPSFKRWFAQRKPDTDGAAGDVVLWADTFGNYLEPAGLQAAVRVLEKIGFRVHVPKQALCCARPLYAEGMLKLARAQLEKTMRALAPYMARDLPVIGLEPACVASFRDELPLLFPGDERADYLSRNTFMLSEFLEQKHWQPPRLGRRLVAHAHCNHHAVMGVAAEQSLLKKLGGELEFLDAGCCGVAGSFGFDAKKYEVSMKIGEHKLLPAVRASGDALIVANGFSCREQIAHGAQREALNLAQILEMALTQQEISVRSEVSVPSPACGRGPGRGP